MDTETMIPASVLCTCHNIELSFICSLKDSGLIEADSIDEQLYLPASQLKRLEQLILLRQEMDINLEGIETVSSLLERINDLQQQIIVLNNRLAFYEHV